MTKAMDTPVEKRECSIEMGCPRYKRGTDSRGNRVQFCTLLNLKGRVIGFRTLSTTSGEQAIPQLFCTEALAGQERTP